MDFATNTVDVSPDLILNQKNTLLEIVKELCSEHENKLNPKLKEKVIKIITDCDLKQYTSLQKMFAADDSTSTLLGFMHQAAAELSYDEQSELNQAFIESIEKQIPLFESELEQLKHTSDCCAKLQKDKQSEVQETDRKLDVLQEQTIEKTELLTEWLNHRIMSLTKFNDNSSELLALRTKKLNLKSKILHLHILHNIFTETNQSIKAYIEIHKDLKNSIKETEDRINSYKKIIGSEYN